ncbi:MAG: type II toxin-antitoxin system RelE/ParE family toxin [Rhizobiaceae bacterium]
MIKAVIVRTPAAKKDLIKIWGDIALDNPVAADRQLDLIDERIKQLVSFPHSGAPRPDIAPEVRVLVVGSYLILHQIVAENKVKIVRVVYGSQNLDNVL